MRTLPSPQPGCLSPEVTDGARVHTGCSWLRLVSRDQLRRLGPLPIRPLRPRHRPAELYGWIGEGVGDGSSVLVGHMFPQLCPAMQFPQAFENTPASAQHASF